jgi:hypothetical protein
MAQKAKSQQTQGKLDSNLLSSSAADLSLPYPKQPLKRVPCGHSKNFCLTFTSKPFPMFFTFQTFFKIANKFLVFF